MASHSRLRLRYGTVSNERNLSRSGDEVMRLSGDEVMRVSAIGNGQSVMGDWVVGVPLMKVQFS